MKKKKKNKNRCQSGALPDTAFSASSVHGWNNHYYGAYRGRLNLGAPGGAWIPNSASRGEWLQVDLGKVQPIGGVATQGRSDYDQWVTQYSVMYSVAGGDWKYYTEGGDRKVFTGNYDRNTAVTQAFKEPFQARYVRFIAEGFNSYVAMRVEVYSTGDASVEGITGEPLGISTGMIKSDQLTASSAHSNNWNYYGPQWSRLNTDEHFGCWFPANNRAGEWIQVDLGKVVPVGGIATQGRAQGSYWVTSYTLQYSKDGETWEAYGREKGNTDVLTGNDDHFTVVKHELKDFRARYIRLVAETFANGWPAVRWEVYAPERPQHRLGGPLGLRQRLADSAFTASSSHGNNWAYYGPQHARLFGGGPWGGWIPNQNQGGEWVQVDLGRVYEVGGVATQGRRWGSYWVRSYMLSYSQDGEEWAFYSMDGEQTIFEGNSDYQTVVRHVLQAPFLARYVRIIVRTFANGWPTLRWELFSPFGGRNKDLALLGVPFGIESGALPSSALSASSSYRTSDKACEPASGRLNSDEGAGAWIASQSVVGEYFEIRTSDSAREIGGVGIQGRNPKSKLYSGNKQWITAFTVGYSKDNGKTWQNYEENGVPRYFAGNSDGVTVVKHAFENPFKADRVRIYPTSWYGAVAGRFELYDTAAYQKDKAEKERLAKIQAIKDAEAEEKAKQDKLAREAYAQKQAIIKARAEEQAALEEQRAAQVAAQVAKSEAAKKAAQDAEAEAEAAVKRLRQKEQDLENAKIVNAAKVKAASEAADARMAVLNRKLAEHRANNALLASARSKLRNLGKQLSEMQLERQDMQSSHKAASADQSANRRLVRKLTKEVAARILELYKIREKYSNKVRTREREIRASEEKSYLNYLERNNPWRRTDPRGWPVLPGGKPRKICSCKDSTDDPLNKKGRKLGSKAAKGAHDTTYDAFKGDRS